MDEYDGLIKSLRIIGNERQTTSPNTVCELIAADVITDLQTRLAAAEKERDEALNELDAIYGALGTADAEDAPSAVDTFADLQARAEAAEAALAKIRSALND